MERNIEASVEYINKSINIYPSNPLAYHSLGNIYYEMGTIDRALQYQQKAIELDPDFAIAHYSSALLYKRLGDSKAAKNHWREYLRIEPSGYYSRKAQEEINNINHGS